MRSGLSLVRRDRHLSAIFLIWSWATLAYAGVNVAEIVLTTDAYGVGSVGFGIFVAFFAAGIVVGNVVAMPFVKRLTVYGGYRASFLVTAAGAALCAVSPGLALGCVGAVIFGIGNGIGLVCNMTLIQQVVGDDRRGQIFAVLGSLVQMFTLVGTLVAGPVTVAVGPRWMWGISAGLLVLGYVNAVVLARRAQREGSPTSRSRSCCRRSMRAARHPAAPSSGSRRFWTRSSEPRVRPPSARRSAGVVAEVRTKPTLRLRDLETLARRVVLHLIATDAADGEVAGPRVAEIDPADGRGRRHRVALGQLDPDTAGVEQLRKACASRSDRGRLDTRTPVGCRGSARRSARP